MYLFARTQTFAHTIGAGGEWHPKDQTKKRINKTPYMADLLHLVPIVVTSVCVCVLFAHDTERNVIIIRCNW